MQTERFELACPACSRVRQAKNADVGKAAHCECGARFTVFAPLPSVTETQSRRGYFRTKGTWSVLRLLLGAVLGAASVWRLFASPSEIPDEQLGVRSELIQEQLEPAPAAIVTQPVADAIQSRDPHSETDKRLAKQAAELQALRAEINRIKDKPAIAQPVRQERAEPAVQEPMGTAFLQALAATPPSPVKPTKKPEQQPASPPDTRTFVPLFEFFDSELSQASYSTGQPIRIRTSDGRFPQFKPVGVIGVVARTEQKGTTQLLEYANGTFILQDFGNRDRRIGRVVHRHDAWVWTAPATSEGRIPVHVVGAADFKRMRFFTSRDAAKQYVKDYRQKFNEKPVEKYGVFYVLPLSKLQ
jgi:hypothetical protein